MPMPDIGMSEASLKKEVAKIDQELNEAEGKGAYCSDSKDRKLQQVLLEKRVRYLFVCSTTPMRVFLLWDDGRRSLVLCHL